MRSPLLLTLGTLALAACGEYSSVTAPRSSSLAPSSERLEKSGDDVPGAVFTATNGASGNSIIAFARADDGSLIPAGVQYVEHVLRDGETRRQRTAGARRADERQARTVHAERRNIVAAGVDDE
jgi:hypothetical protein